MKKKIIGGLIMAILIVPLVILGGYCFQVACAFLGIFALKEFLDLKEHHKKIPKCMIGVSVFTLVGLILLDLERDSLAFGFPLQRIALVMLLLLLPCLFYKEEKYTAKDAIYICSVVLFLGILFNALVCIRHSSLWLLLYLAIVAMFTDIFAMLIGQLIGKNKCAPTISPNKTWEGTIGGLIVGTGVSTMFYYFKIGNALIYKILILSFLLSIVGQLGDLFFSKIKRENKIKDFSKLIPGHGGILDRLDSLSFIVLAYVLLYGIV